MTIPANRFVVGPDPQGRSAVLQRGLTNVQSREGFFWRATLWATQETPVDNSVEGDRSRPRVWAHNVNPSPTDSSAAHWKSRLTIPTPTNTAACSPS